jgi:hypothetical protein
VAFLNTYHMEVGEYRAGSLHEYAVAVNEQIICAQSRGGARSHLILLMGRRVDHGKSFAASTSVRITIVAGVVHKLQAKHVYRLVFNSISYFIATAYESRIVYWLLLRLPQITTHFQKRPYSVAVGVRSNLRGN